jgi:hypothetical protein
MISGDLSIQRPGGVRLGLPVLLFNGGTKAGSPDQAGSNIADGSPAIGPTFNPTINIMGGDEPGLMAGHGPHMNLLP